MQLDLVEVSVGARLSGAYAGDVDGDGRDELVLATTTAAGDAPDRVTLVIVHVGADGKIGATSKVDLGNRPVLWDVGDGLWVIDAEGVSKVASDTGALTRVAGARTVLSGFGAATPAHVDFTEDLDGDGRDELIVPAPGKLLAFSADGTAWGSVPMRSESILGANARLGGTALALTATPQSWTVADMDGDGRKDILLPSHKSLAVYYTGDKGLGARAATVALPLDVEPPEEPMRAGVERRSQAAVWLEDLDGDKKVDLLVHRWVTSGGFFGATAEILWSLGSGTSFGPMVTIRTPAAAFGVEPMDVDGDGDQDIVTREADVGIGNVARALLSKAVKVSLGTYPMGGHAFPMTAIPVRAFSFPVDPPMRFQEEWSADVDGDGRMDLVTNDGQDLVRVYRGRPGGLDTGPAWEKACAIPLTDDAFLVHDLNGDKRAEIVVWGEGERVARVLTLR